MKRIFPISIKSLVLLFLSYFLFLNLEAKTIFITNSETQTIGTPDVLIYIDKENEQSYIDILASPPSFIPVQKVKEFDPSFTYWVKIDITNNLKTNEKLVLEYGNIHTKEMVLFYQLPGQKLVCDSAGYSIHFKSRHKYPVTNFVYDIPSTAEGTSYSLFFKIKTYDLLNLGWTIKNQWDFTAYTVKEYHYLGIYYGILLIMAIYNLLLYFAARERVYLFYVLYVLSCMLSSYAEDGLGFQFLWQDTPSINHIISYYIAPVSFLVSFIFYSSSFLNLKRNYPKLYQYLLIITGSYLIYLLLEATVIPIKYHLNQLYTLPFISVYVISLYTLKKGYKPAKFFIIANTLVFISVIIAQLRVFGLLEVSGTTGILLVYSFNIGIVLEIIMLSFALSDRIKHLKQEKEKAKEKIIEQLEQNKVLQEKVNLELEEKVYQRTSDLVNKSNELKEANERLEKMAIEISKMNEQLDIQNWNLNKQIKEQKKELLADKTLDFNEFQQVYPSDMSCLKFLEKMKWGNDFKCKKCQHRSYSKRAKLLSRKCSSCGYIESALTNTIYSGVRFDLNKAFYITYVTTQDPKITIEQLMNELSITRNTAWKFKQKVSTQLSSKKNVQNWYDLILNES